MKALVYNGVGKIAVEERPDPKVEAPGDCVVRLTRTTICGTDLHIIKGDVPSVAHGRVLGHEGVGVVEEAGANVKGFKKGDRVLIACITSCGTCNFCRKGIQAHCFDGGWQLGHLLNGTQAEYVRIANADASLHHVPDGADERQLLVFSDILPTGLEVGVIRGEVKPGSTVAVVGTGPVGLAAILTAQLYSPATLVAIDRDPGRLKLAKQLGATHSVQCDKPDEVREKSKEHFGDIDGFDVVIEAVGIPDTFQMCTNLVAKGGTIANIGVHGSKVQFDLDTLWVRNIKLTTALVSANTIPLLLKLYAAKKIDVSSMVTHDFKFSEIEKAYDVFKRATETGAIKMNIEF